jgi:hypothetical protein
MKSDSHVVTKILIKGINYGLNFNPCESAILFFVCGFSRFLSSGHFIHFFFFSPLYHILSSQTWYRVKLFCLVLFAYIAHGREYPYRIFFFFVSTFEHNNKESELTCPVIGYGRKRDNFHLITFVNKIDMSNDNFKRLKSIININILMTIKIKFDSINKYRMRNVIWYLMYIFFL